MPPEGRWADLVASLGLADLAGRAVSDPLVAYSLLAAAILAVASLAGGLARGGARALARPAPWAAVALAALAALALAAAGERVEAAAPGAWPLTGLRRLPLYLVSIGYGPIAGVMAALLFATTERTLGALPVSEAVLVLEMAVVGWLALAPSPRRSRWAAPLAVLLGWAMATATAGLAALAWLHRPLPSDVVLDAWRHDLPGVAATVGLLFAASPRWWRKAAPGAATDRADAAGGSAGIDPLDAGEWALPPLRRERARRERAHLGPTRLPHAMRRARRDRRRLTPPSLPDARLETARGPALAVPSPPPAPFPIDASEAAGPSVGTAIVGTASAAGPADEVPSAEGVGEVDEPSDDAVRRDPRGVGSDTNET